MNEVGFRFRDTKKGRYFRSHFSPVSLTFLFSAFLFFSFRPSQHSVYGQQSALASRCQYLCKWLCKWLHGAFIAFIIRRLIRFGCEIDSERYFLSGSFQAAFKQLTKHPTSRKGFLFASWQSRNTRRLANRCKTNKCMNRQRIVGINSEYVFVHIVKAIFEMP